MVVWTAAFLFTQIDQTDDNTVRAVDNTYLRDNSVKSVDNEEEITENDVNNDNNNLNNVNIDYHVIIDVDIELNNDIVPNINEDKQCVTIPDDSTLVYITQHYNNKDLYNDTKVDDDDINNPPSIVANDDLGETMMTIWTMYQTMILLLQHQSIPLGTTCVHESHIIMSINNLIMSIM
jgi:hypothetical protein